jgi:hypothetical protein
MANWLLCAEAPEKCYEADIGLGRITSPPQRVRAWRPALGVPVELAAEIAGDEEPEALLDCGSAGYQQPAVGLERQSTHLVG